MIPKDAVWLVTGCSKGLGQALARHLLASGHRVVATARQASDLDALVVGQGDRALALALDVTQPDQVAAAVTAAETHFGGIDVLVNNAGYGYFGAIEEGDDAEVRAMFEADVFGPVAMIKAVLPGMRARGAGHVVNLSSVGGFVTQPGVGYYHMAKFALEGLSEALAQEVGPLGIGVTIVEPGPFRTDFRGGSAREARARMLAYEATAGKTRDAIKAGNGNQLGDPARAARAILAAVEAEHPPLHLVLGGAALDLMRRKIAALEADWAAWEDTSRSTDFPDALVP